MTRQQAPLAPTDADVGSRLGPAARAFQALLADHPRIRPEWKWYGARQGWILKLVEGKRNLCFVTPAEGHFHVSFVLGHEAVQQALLADLPPHLRHAIAAAPTYPEGRGVRLEVRGEGDLGPVMTLLEIKRGGGRGKRSQPGAPAKRGEPVATTPGRGGAPERAERVPAAHRRGRTP